LVLAASTAPLVASIIAAACGLIAAAVVAWATLRSKSYDDLINDLEDRFARDLREGRRQLLQDIQREFDALKRDNRNHP
jgi:cobalamin biosynthesis protein CobD/CbiB